MHTLTMTYFDVAMLTFIAGGIVAALAAWRWL